MNRFTRRAFLRDLAGLGASMAALGLVAGCAPAQPARGPARVYRIGVLRVPNPDVVVPQFWARLEELGYVEGQNLVKIDRSTGGAPADQNLLAMEMARLPVDVMVAGLVDSMRAAMAASTSIPIVMMGGNTDPVASGYVASLARPGGNVTGFMGTPGELAVKRLEQLVEAVPTVSKVAVLEPNQGQRDLLQAAAQALGVALVFELVETREDIDAAFEHAVALGADALLMRTGTVTPLDPDRIIELAERHRLPASYVRGSNVKAGGLMAFEPRFSEIGRRTADYVDRILRGTKPADLPVELPTRYDLTVNVRTARALGLTFPAAFLAQVDEFIE